MDAELGVCRLDVAFYRVDGEIKGFGYLLMLRVAIIHPHYPVLGVAQLGVEPRHADHTFQGTLPSQRAFDLFEV